MTFASMSAAIAAWVLTYLVHSTIFIVGAIVLSRWLRDRPEHMSGIWKVALVGGVLTATVQVGLGVAPLGGRVTLEPGGPVAPVVASEVAGLEPAPLDLVAGDPLPPSRLATAPSEAPSSIDDAAWPEAEPAAIPMGARAVASSAEPSPPAIAPAVPRVPGWTLAIAIVVVLGASLGLASVALAVRGLRRRLSDRRPLAEGVLLGMFRDLVARCGLRRRVGLSVSRSTTVPLAMGIARPEIVLPERATSGLATGQQHTMLAHELAHVFRHDPAWRMAALLAERVFFFQPLNRVAGKRMAECAEYLCDDWAARHTDERLALAQCLTEVASWVGASPVVLASAMAGTSSQLRHRVLRLLAPARPAPRRGTLGAAAALAIAAVAWLAPGVSFGDSSEDTASVASATELVAPPEHAHNDEVPMRIVAAADGKVVILGANEDDEDDDAREAEQTQPSSDDPKARRRAKRRAAKANREADRALAKAMRKARKQGRAAPSDEEVERILARARKQAGQEPRAHAERFELHLVLPDGSAHIEIEGGEPRVIDIDDLVEQAHRRHGRGRGHADHHADHHANRAAKRALKEAMKQRKRALQEGEHARRQLRHQLRMEDLPPEARRAIERALRDLDRSMKEAEAFDPFWIAAPPAPTAPPSPPTARAPAAPPAPFGHAPAPMPAPFADAPPAPSPPAVEPAPFVSPRGRARSRRGAAPPAPPRVRGRAPSVPAPASPPHDIQTIVWTG